MEYYDWLIISFAMIIIVFITLLGIAILEKGLKEKKWLLWFSIAGLVVSVIITGFLIWYFHKENKKKDRKKGKKEEKKNKKEIRKQERKNKKEIKKPKKIGYKDMKKIN